MFAICQTIYTGSKDTIVNKINKKQIGKAPGFSASCVGMIGVMMGDQSRECHVGTKPRKQRIFRQRI